MWKRHILHKIILYGIQYLNTNFKFEENLRKNYNRENYAGKEMEAPMDFCLKEN